MASIDPALLAAFRAAAIAKIQRDLETEERTARGLRERVIPLVRDAVAAARAEGLCGRAWLFGSIAWGQPGERSDVDLVVESAVDPDRLAARVAAVCRRDVHLIPLEEAPASLRERALAEGIAL